MKKNVCLAAVAVVLMGCAGGGSSPERTVDKSLEDKVEKLISKMTLEEKIGQMTQLTLDVVGKGPNQFSSYIPFEFDEAFLDSAIGKYKIGSFLNIPSNSPLTIEEWENVITTLQKRSIDELGIPTIYGVDEIHGASYTIGSTLFPQQIAMGATFNRDLVKKGSEISAYETRASNVPWTFSPVLDMGRNQSWSRIWETYGEDVYLVSEMGVACVEGYQGMNPGHVGMDHVAACLKHYMGYGAPISGKDRTPSMITEREMRERHFEPFVQAIRAGALSVMVNSAVNDGEPLHASHKYLQKWLKDDLNWDGVLVTDWNDINNIYARDRVVATKKEAIEMAINAGIDMSMVPYEWEFCILLKELVKEGKVKMERIDDAVRRVLRMKIRLNLFEKPYWSCKDYPEFASAAHAQVALESAQEAITLLKNVNGVLPLSKNAKVLVTGPNANSMRTLNGGWSLSWQGANVEQYMEQYNTIVEAFRNKVGKDNVVFVEGVSYDFKGNWDAELVPDYASVMKAVKDVDCIVVCVGENSYCETPGNLNDLHLSDNQQNLVTELAKTGKPVVLVLNEGRPRLISKIEPVVAAVVQTYLPGNYGGDALADIIYGDVNPSGKLPYTYPKYPNALITYDHKPSESMATMDGVYDYNAQTDVQYPFGYGLSYTTFEYSDLAVNKTEFNGKDELIFTVNVKNAGNIAGKESVLLFASDLVATISPDVRRLRAFQKIELQPGETKQVIMNLNAADLAFVNAKGDWVIEKGDYLIQVADKTLKIKCTHDDHWHIQRLGSHGH